MTVEIVHQIKFTILEKLVLESLSYLFTESISFSNHV